MNNTPRTGNWDNIIMRLKIIHISYLTAVVFLMLTLISSIYGHPQCLDYRPPFYLETNLTFCTEYASYGCCTRAMEAEIEQEYTMYLALSNGNEYAAEDRAFCLNAYKNLLCQRCSPYAAHLYDAEETGIPRSYPGLCRSYCGDIYRRCTVCPSCSNTFFNDISVPLESEDAMCQVFTIPDVDYCYPELLTNPVLNSDIENEVLTQDGCLCLEEFTSGLRNPLSFDVSPDGTGRIFIAEQIGIVHIYFKNGTKLNTPFMDITNIVLTSSRRGDERGFLGLAFHPDFGTNRRFYVYFTLWSNSRQTVRISQFLASATNPNVIDYNSERVILEVPQPYSNHNGGEILFDFDGFLYIFVGDGGSGGDPHNYAQDKTTLLGKVLRIDVDSPADPGLSYRIPRDNPFYNEDGARKEIYAYGIRNTWRCDIDAGHPDTGENRGRIICGDVGQSSFEELNEIVSGGNYGWNSREGFECYRQSTCGRIGPEELPIYAYSHSVGKSITGGHTYRGCNSPNLQGKYIYGDYVNGKIFTLEESGNQWENNEVTMCGSDYCFNGLISNYKRNILSFGEDDDGEVYLLSTSNPSPTAFAGSVYKIVDPRRRGDAASCRTYIPPPTSSTQVPDTSTSMSLPARTTTTQFSTSGSPISGGCTRIDLAFALDTSGSVRETGWRKMQQFIQDILRHFEISTDCTRVAMLSFGTVAYLYSYLDEDVTYSEINNIIQSMNWRDEWTNTGAALGMLSSAVFTNRNGNRDGVSDLAIFITDGPSNRERQFTIPNAEAARRQDIKLMTIGIGPSIVTNELEAITADTNSNLYFPSFDAMLQSENMVLDKIYEISETHGDGDIVTTRDTVLPTTSTTTTSTTSTTTSTTTTTTSTTTATPTTTTNNDNNNEDFSCTFEDINGVSTWCDMIQASDDNFDWSMGRGNTPSDPTGPSRARSGQYYIFIEATGKQPRDLAVIYLPVVTSNAFHCLSFSYHMFGWHIDTLYVAIQSPNGNNRTVWSEIGEQGEFWIDATVTFEMNRGDRVAFIGQRGNEYSGDIGLDSITLRTGRC